MGQGICKELRRVEVAVAVSYQNKNTKRMTFGLVLFLRSWKQRLCKVEQTHTVLPYFIEIKSKSIFLEACVDLYAWSGVH